MQRLCALAVLLAVTSVVLCPAPDAGAGEPNSPPQVVILPGSSDSDDNGAGDGGDIIGTLGDPDDYLGGNGIVIPDGATSGVRDGDDYLDLMKYWMQIQALVGMLGR